jgi:hypothetical protein
MRASLSIEKRVEQHASGVFGIANERLEGNAEDERGRRKENALPLRPPPSPFGETVTNPGYLSGYVVQNV